MCQTKVLPLLQFLFKYESKKNIVNENMNPRKFLGISKKILEDHAVYQKQIFGISGK